MKKLLTLAVTSAAISFGATFTGLITDNMCDNGEHKGMNMGTDPKCVVACVKDMKGKYVLYDAVKKVSYVLSDQKTPEKFAAKKVTVTGTLDEATKTIRVDSIAAAK